MKFISHWIDLMVAPRFKRAESGEMLFYPMGFGRGRIIPDPDREQQLRRQCRRYLIAFFLIVIPVMSLAFNAFRARGIGAIAAGLAIGLLSNAYVYWISRDLAVSGERQSYGRMMEQQFARMRWPHILFGLGVSTLFSALCAAFLLYPGLARDSDTLGMWFGIAVFAPLALLYGFATIKRLRKPAAAS
jgi:hypothetical protein